MASTRGGWDAAAFRRQCAIPPDQLAKLNSLPGWARAMQTASLDETPDGSPTPSQQPANEVAQPRRRPARGGAFLREQAARAPRLVDDDSDDSDSDSDPAVNAARVVQSMRDPQMRGLRGVAVVPKVRRGRGRLEVPDVVLPGRHALGRRPRLRDLVAERGEVRAQRRQRVGAGC